MSFFSYSTSIPLFLETPPQFSFENHLSPSRRPCAPGGTNPSVVSENGYGFPVWPINMAPCFLSPCAHAICAHVVEAQMMNCRPRPPAGITGEEIPFLPRMAISWEFLSSPFAFMQEGPARRKLTCSWGRKIPEHRIPYMLFRNHLCTKLELRVT